MVPIIDGMMHVVKRHPRIGLGNAILARNHIYDQVLNRIVDGSAPLDQAIDDPRLHCSIGATISREAERFDAATIAGLKDAGYEVDPRDAYAFYLRCVQAVPRRQSGMGYQPQPPRS